MSSAWREDEIQGPSPETGAGSSIFPPAQLPPLFTRSSCLRGESRDQGCPMEPLGSALSRRCLAAEAHVAGLPLTLPLPDGAPQLDFIKKTKPLFLLLTVGVLRGGEGIETSSTWKIISCLPAYLKLMQPTAFLVNVKLIWKVFMYCSLPWKALITSHWLSALPRNWEGSLTGHSKKCSWGCSMWLSVRAGKFLSPKI